MLILHHPPTNVIDMDHLGVIGASVDPRTDSQPGVLRALAATATCGAAAAGLCHLAAGATRGAPAPDAVVATAVLGLGALAATVLALGCALLTVSGVSAALGRRWWRVEAAATRLLPMALRRALTIGIGAGLSLGMGTSALADEVDVGWQVTSGSTTATVTDPTVTDPRATDLGVTATRVTDVAPAVVTTAEVTLTSAERGEVPSPARQEPAVAPPARTLTVEPGDSLWAITARLMPGASDAEIAVAWPLLYAANRDRVGPDPGLIHPGDVLVVPEGISA